MVSVCTLLLANFYGATGSAEGASIVIAESLSMKQKSDPTPYTITPKPSTLNPETYPVSRMGGAYPASQRGPPTLSLGGGAPTLGGAASAPGWGG